MSSMQSGGATPEIRQNYGGGHIVFNAIHAWSLVPSWSQNQKKRSRNIVLLPFFWRTDFDILQEIGEVVQHMIWSSQETWNSVRCKWIEGVNSRDFGCCCVTATSVLWRLTGWDWMMRMRSLCSYSQMGKCAKHPSLFLIYKWCSPEGEMFFVPLFSLVAR